MMPNFVNSARMCLAVTTVALAASAIPAVAQSATAEDLLEAMDVKTVVQIMQTEGYDYADSLAADMLPGGATEAWKQTVKRIYDADRMEATVKAEFLVEFADHDVAPLMAFFVDGPGAQFIALENSARRAMMDEGVEEAAREVYKTQAANPDARYDLMEDFVQANGLIDANVEGAMNAAYQFYRGLANGGALDSGEDDIIADVYETEPETRVDTREWVYGFLLMAYRPMSDADLQAYVDLSNTDAGRALNRALFAGFDRMYGDISYALGLAIARAMQTQEL